MILKKKSVALSLSINKSEYIVENIVGAAVGYEMEALRILLRMLAVIDLRVHHCS